MSDNTIIPPAQVINDTDKAGIITVVTTFCLVCVCIIFGIRVYTRTKVNGPWKWDDTCVAAATVLSCVRSAISYLEVSRGYGKSKELLDANDFVQIGKALYGDHILYIAGLFFSKAAVILLCQRMTPKRGHTIAIWSIFGVSLTWAVASILTVSVNCSPAHPWVNLNGYCVDMAARWKAICAVDILTEIALFSSSIYLVAGLHMSFYLKAIVVLAFGIRLPTIAFSAARLNSILVEISSPDPTLAGAYTSAWTSIALDFSIIACTFSSLGAFLKPFTKEIGRSRSDTHPSYGLNSHGSGHHNTSRGKAQTSSSSLGGEVPILRHDASPSVAVVTFNGNASGEERLSEDSNDSKKGIIMKQVQWSVIGVKRDSETRNRG